LIWFESCVAFVRGVVGSLRLYITILLGVYKGAGATKKPPEAKCD